MILTILLDNSMAFDAFTGQSPPLYSPNAFSSHHPKIKAVPIAPHLPPSWAHPGNHTSTPHLSAFSDCSFRMNGVTICDL